MRKIRTAAGLFLAAMVAASLMAAPATAAGRQDAKWFGTGSGKLTLVHGVPGANGFPVDISVYRLAVGSQVFEDVTFGTVAGPLELRSGIYRVAIREAGAPRYSSPILSKWLWLGSGANMSVVAHLKADGSPTITAYRNDVSPTGGDARVIVRHDAAAPAVDVLAGRTAVISGLRNPNQAAIEVPGGTYPISVTPAGAGYANRVFGPADLEFKANKVTIVYAVGSLAGGSFTPLVQVLPAG